MTLIAYDIYSGFIEDTLNVLGSRDMTLMERYQRLGDYSQHALGLLPDVMDGWEKALETLIMNPPAQLTTLAEAVALIIIMRDAGQRRFRIITEGRRDDILLPTFDHLGHPEFNKDFIRSEIGGFTSPVPEIDWGFLDINQVEALLLDAQGLAKGRQAFLRGLVLLLLQRELFELHAVDGSAQFVDILL